MKRGLQAAIHSGGLTLHPFTEADLDDLHSATLEILERTGVLVEADDAIDILADSGCKTDRQTHIVKIPPELVTQSVRSARRSFLLAGRDPEHDVMVEVGRVTVAPFAEGIMVNDLETGENRQSTKQDVEDIMRVTDALSQMDINIVPVTARDVPVETAEVHHIEAALKSTTKPILMAMTQKHSAELGLDMAAAVVGGHDALRERPLLCYCTCPVGPMYLTRELTDIDIECARKGMPFCCISMDMTGASAPITLASTLVVQNAELLASLVLNQLVAAGSPFYYGTSTCAFELRQGSAAVGTPEMALIQAGTAALANYYSIPSFTAGY